MKTAKYTPINCSFYDELEALATLRRKADILYFDVEGKEQKVTDLIVDFFIEDKVEYMKLKSGQTIRLDYLISVNGLKLKGYC
ncbi:MAG: Rho-binding antiterminator [Saprospiraceae bacterium]|nr:Rho-binding antiterminator [Saprospiraceae bacterium]